MCDYHIFPRFVNAAHDLILEGPSYRENQKPGRKPNSEG